MQQIRCEQCNEISPSYNIIHYGSTNSGYRQLCTRCYNAEVAKRYGLSNFENIQLEPIGINDCTGEKHEFHFRTHLMGHIISIEAFELQNGSPGGYLFQQVSTPEEDLFTLLGHLIQKMRRALAVKHVEVGQFGLQIINQTVRGRIESDLNADARTPLVVVDGREISWKEFGEMLMTFEGWQFRLHIADPSEDV